MQKTILSTILFSLLLVVAHSDLLKQPNTTRCCSSCPESKNSYSIFGFAKMQISLSTCITNNVQDPTTFINVLRNLPITYTQTITKIVSKLNADKGSGSFACQQVDPNAASDIPEWQAQIMLDVLKNFTSLNVENLTPFQVNLQLSYLNQLQTLLNNNGQDEFNGLASRKVIYEKYAQTLILRSPEKQQFLLGCTVGLSNKFMGIQAPDTPDYTGESESYFYDYVSRFTGNPRFMDAVSSCRKGSFDSSDVNGVTSTSPLNPIELPMDISVSADASLYDGTYSLLISGINADNTGGRDLQGLVKAAQQAYIVTPYIAPTAFCYYTKLLDALKLTCGGSCNAAC